MNDDPVNRPTIILPLTPRDLADALRIEQAGQLFPWSEALLIQELSHEYAFHFGASTGDGTPMGAFILCRLFCGELHVHNLCTDPPFRRRGLATALLRYAIGNARARGAENAFLEVRRSNDPAVSFYTREGFSITGVRATYYSNGDDALTMHRAIG